MHSIVTPDRYADLPLVDRLRARLEHALLLITPIALNASQKTRERYMSLMRALNEGRLMPTSEIRNRNSFYQRRAAFLYAMKVKVISLAETCISAIRKGDLSACKALDIELLEIIRRIEANRPDPLKLAKDAAQNVAATGSPGPGRWNKTRGKRASLVGMPDDWMDVLWKAVEASKSHYKEAIAVMFCTGARPCEFKGGIEFERQGDALKLTIICAKRMGDTGRHEPRTIVRAPDTRYCQYLIECLRDRGCRKSIVRCKASALHDAVVPIARRLWPKKKIGISPYSVRHQLSANLKAALGPEKVAQAMGHSSLKSQSQYGTRSQSRGRWSPPVAVSSSRPVKPTPPTRPRPSTLRKKKNGPKR